VVLVVEVRSAAKKNQTTDIGQPVASALAGCFVVMYIVPSR
jgi:hypothetical protein